MRVGPVLPYVALLLAPIIVPPRPVDPGSIRKQVKSQPFARNAVLDGITFDVDRGKLFVPIDELKQALDLPLEWDRSEGKAYFGKAGIHRKHLRRLLDGTPVVSLRLLQENSIGVSYHPRWFMASLGYRNKRCWVREGVKRIAVNRKRQWLRGWQGRRLVLETPVSTGAAGFTTPTGRYTAGPFKARMHHSSIYNDAPMPFTVQVVGNVCIHGSASVPRYPASHGCIRVPLTGTNPARHIYEWIDRGAAVQITDGWPWRKSTGQLSLEQKAG